MGKGKHSVFPPTNCLMSTQTQNCLTFTLYLCNPFEIQLFSGCCCLHWQMVLQSTGSYSSLWLKGLILGKLYTFPASYGNFVLFCVIGYTENPPEDDSHQSNRARFLVLRQYQVQGVPDFHLNKEQNMRNEVKGTNGKSEYMSGICNL